MKEGAMTLQSDEQGPLLLDVQWCMSEGDSHYAGSLIHITAGSGRLGERLLCGRRLGEGAERPDKLVITIGDELPEPRCEACLAAREG